MPDHQTTYALGLLAGMMFLPQGATALALAPPAGNPRPVGDMVVAVSMTAAPHLSPSPPMLLVQHRFGDYHGPGPPGWGGHDGPSVWPDGPRQPRRHWDSPYVRPGPPHWHVNPPNSTPRRSPRPQPWLLLVVLAAAAGIGLLALVTHQARLRGRRKPPPSVQVTLGIDAGHVRIIRHAPPRPPSTVGRREPRATMGPSGWSERERVA
jgi:hypothetical protein